MGQIEHSIGTIEVAIRKIRDFITKGEIRPKKKTVRTPEIEILEVKLWTIKMNLKPEMLIHVLRSSFIKKKILIIINNHLGYLKEALNAFYDYIFERTFSINILILTEEEYQEKEYKLKDYIVLLDGEILGENKNIINLKNNKFEEEIIKDFYNDSHSLSSIINLRDKIEELYALSRKIFRFHEEIGLKLSSKAMKKHLENTLFIKIKKDYFNFLIDVASRYFNGEIKFTKDLVADKITELWGK